MIYRSKKDVWLVLIIALSLAFCFGAGILLLLNGTGSERMAGWVTIGVGVAVCALILWLSYPLYYEISPSSLLVRSGVMRWNIPLEDIEEVVPTNNPLSSPAMSLDRLRVSYKARGARTFVLISPQDKSGFINELASAAPGLQMTGQTLKKKGR